MLANLFNQLRNPFSGKAKARCKLLQHILAAFVVVELFKHGARFVAVAKPSRLQ